MIAVFFVLCRPARCRSRDVDKWTMYMLLKSCFRKMPCTVSRDGSWFGFTGLRTTRFPLRNNGLDEVEEIERN
jgi:hypothetical protein